MPYKSMYAASKSFVYSFSRALSEELKETSISVSVLCPGSVPTNDRIKQSIRLHGWFAKYTSLEPGEMASIAIRDTLRKKKIIIPGFCNKISLLLMKVIPSALRLNFLARVYRKKILNA
jgi:short-subunit dehydrogenase